MDSVADLRVQKRLTRPSPLVVATGAAAIGKEPDETGRLVLQGGVARLKVSRPALPRALRILDALCKEADRRGWSVEASSRYTGRPVAVIARKPCRVEFDIVEETLRVPHIRTPAEEAKARATTFHGVPRWDYTPQGRLTLRLDHYLVKRRKFTDGVRRCLDVQLVEVLAEVSRIFDAEERREADRDRDKQQKRQEAVQSIEVAYLCLVEERRREAANALLVAWRDARDLEDYARHVRLALDTQPPALRQESEGWLRWLDPFVEELKGRAATPALPPDPRRNDASNARRIAGQYGGEAWLEWLRLTGEGGPGREGAAT